MIERACMKREVRSFDFAAVKSEEEESSSDAPGGEKPVCERLSISSGLNCLSHTCRG